MIDLKDARRTVETEGVKRGETEYLRKQKKHALNERPHQRKNRYTKQEEKMERGGETKDYTSSALG